ncbi:extracellular solute-binding protein [Halorussus salilacus]|uniref:extracellular solute-binding protein n=1 Tax=Halorussus salilacus TaxID=2953750 RepID=UPI00209EB679|nr:extracellular solute-binding protein [Halorussus salilacus]USZ68423.1 extracellular solute-binding protein [Halorussus salilacus]
MSERRRWTRRRFLATSSLAGTAGLAGCMEGLPFGGQEESTSALSLDDFRGSGPMVESRPEPGGTSMDDLPDLEGELNLYLGGGEGGLYQNLVDLLEQKYPDFDVQLKMDGSSTLANTIIEEKKGGESPADVFWSIDSTSLGVAVDAGVTTPLPDRVLDEVPEGFRESDGNWVGVAGRARAISYNTDELSESDIPNDVHEFPETAALEDAVGWAPTYGAFKSFVTAMRLISDEDDTREWLEGMIDHGTTEYQSEFLASNAVADGEISAAFANHYYAIRVMASRPDAPIDLAFTENDAGALVNVSGVEMIEGTDKSELVGDFARHLLSSEAQEFFVTRAFAYPMISGVEPVGGLPTVDELSPPDVDLSELSDLDPTNELLDEVGL